MQFLDNLDETTLNLLHKFTTQMSTTLRTFSKLVVSLKKTGDKKSRPVTPVIVLKETEITCPVLKKTETLREKGQLVDWIFSKNCGWRMIHGKDLALWVLDGRYRADRCGSTWEQIGADAENRSSWRVIPNSKVRSLYVTYTRALDDSKELVENATHGWLDRIRPSKVARKGNILKSTPISFKVFVKIMKEHHKELTPLRG